MAHTSRKYTLSTHTKNS